MELQIQKTKLQLKVVKGAKYVCIKDVKVPSGYGIYCHKGGIYTSFEDGYLMPDKGYQFKPYEGTISEYFRLATAEEILIGRELTEEQQLLIQELKLKMRLAVINFMKCGLTEEESIEQVDIVVKSAIDQVFHPKK